MHIFRLQLQHSQGKNINRPHMSESKPSILSSNPTESHHEIHENLLSKEQQWKNFQEIKQNKAKMLRDTFEEKQFGIYILKGVGGLFGGLCIHLVIGSLYQWGLMSPYITSYFKLHGYPEITSKETGVIFPLMMFFIGTTMALGLKLGKRIGYVKVLLINNIIISGLVFSSSWTNNIYVFTLLYAIGFGLSAGQTFMIPIKLCNEYFPRRQTYVNGFILIGTGMGPVAFGLLSISYMNPQQVNPLQGFYIGQLSYIANEIPACIRMLSLAYLIVGVIGSLCLFPVELMVRKIDNLKESVLEMTPEAADRLSRPVEFQHGECLSVKQAFTSHLFYLHILIITLGSCGSLFINSNYKVYAKQHIYDDQFLTLIGVVGSIANGTTRFFWSQLFNKIGYKFIMIVIIFINMVCMITVRFALNSQAAYLIQVFWFNATLGGLLVVAPTFSNFIFGKNVGPMIFGVFWCAFAIGNFVQYIYTVTLQQTIGISNIIYVCLGMNTMNLAIILTCKFKAKWNNDTNYFQMRLPMKVPVFGFEEKIVHSILTREREPMIPTD